MASNTDTADGKIALDADDFLGEPAGGPRHERDRAEPAATRDEALSVLGAHLAAGLHGMRHELDALGRRERTVRGGSSHGDNVASGWVEVGWEGDAARGRGRCSVPLLRPLAPSPSPRPQPRAHRRTGAGGYVGRDPMTRLPSHAPMQATGSFDVKLTPLPAFAADDPTASTRSRP